MHNQVPLLKLIFALLGREESVGSGVLSKPIPLHCAYGACWDGIGTDRISFHVGRHKKLEFCQFIAHNRQVFPLIAWLLLALSPLRGLYLESGIWYTQFPHH